MSKLKTKVAIRKRRHNRVRSLISGTSKKPRLSVFRSNKSIYAQIIDDTTGKTICATSDLKSKKSGNLESAKLVGAELAKLALEKKVKQVIFDRSGYSYHGKVKVLAEELREAGILA